MTIQYRWKNTNKPLGLSEGWALPLNRGDRLIELRNYSSKGEQISRLWKPTVRYRVTAKYGATTLQCNAIEIFLAKMRLKFYCRALIFFPEFPQYQVFLFIFFLRLYLLTHATDIAENEDCLTTEREPLHRALWPYDLLILSDARWFSWDRGHSSQLNY